MHVHGNNNSSKTIMILSTMIMPMPSNPSIRFGWNSHNVFVADSRGFFMLSLFCDKLMAADKRKKPFKMGDRGGYYYFRRPIIF